MPYMVRFISRSLTIYLNQINELVYENTQEQYKKAPKFISLRVLRYRTYAAQVYENLKSFKDNYLSVPYLRELSGIYDIIWRINIKKVISSDCFIRFVVENVSLISGEISSILLSSL